MAICKSWNGDQGTQWRDEGNDGNAGNQGANAGNQGGNVGNAGNQGENDRNAGNQGRNAGNQGGNDGNQGGNVGNQGGNMRNQSGNVGNKGGNLRIGLELMNHNCGEGQEICVSCYSVNVQRQSSIGVLQKRCSAKTQQIYWRSPMQMCDVNKVA